MKRVYAVFLGLVISVTVTAGCAASRQPCPGLSKPACRELLALYELVPGEILAIGSPVTLERREGLNGVWIGDTIIRVVVDAGVSCRGDAVKAKKKIMRIFKSIYFDDLSQRGGMINFEMSMIAYEKEMAALVNSAMKIKTDHSGDGCRTVFQVMHPCLKSLVSSGTSGCRQHRR